MPQSLASLRTLQMGVEATSGTEANATSQIVGEWTVTERIDRDYEEHPRGVRADVHAGGDDLRHATEIKISANLTYEDIERELAACVDDPAHSGAGPYVHTFAPVLSGPATYKSFTSEWYESDGTTKHVERLALYSLCSKFKISGAMGELAKVESEWFARKSSSTTVTPGLAPPTGRAKISSDLFGIWINDAGASIGTTQKTGLLRSWELEVEGGNVPDYTADAASSLDFRAVKAGKLRGTFKATIEMGADAATELTKWRGSSGKGLPRFIRLKATDGTKIVQFDFCLDYTEAPEIEDDDDDGRLLNITGKLEYDATWGKVFEAVITNSLATLP